MKTSEFIRNAVDAYLAPDRDTWLAFDYRKYLCNVFEYYAHANNIYIPPYIDPLIQAELPEGYASLDCHVEWLSFEEVQCIRFMYAEFLALYFEDIGD